MTSRPFGFDAKTYSGINGIATQNTFGIIKAPTNLWPKWIIPVKATSGQMWIGYTDIAGTQTLNYYNTGISSKNPTSAWRRRLCSLSIDKTMMVVGCMNNDNSNGFSVAKNAEIKSFTSVSPNIMTSVEAGMYPYQLSNKQWLTTGSTLSNASIWRYDSNFANPVASSGNLGTGNCYEITQSSTGDIYATGGSGSANYIYKSTDNGSNWSLLGNLFSDHCRGVATNGSNVLVAGINGWRFSSNAGSTWISPNTTLNSYGAYYKNGIYIICGCNSTASNIQTSTDGVNWVTSGASTGLLGVINIVFDNTSNAFLNVITSGTNRNAWTTYPFASSNTFTLINAPSEFTFQTANSFSAVNTE